MRGEVGVVLCCCPSCRGARRAPLGRPVYQLGAPRAQPSATRAHSRDSKVIRERGERELVRGDLKNVPRVNLVVRFFFIFRLLFTSA